MEIFVDIAALILLVVGLIGAWVWVCLGIRKQGLRRVAGSVAVQLTVLSGAIGILIAGGVGLLLALFPPLSFIFWWETYAEYSGFFRTPVLSALLPATATFAACMVIPKANDVSLIIAGLMFLTVVVSLGDNQSKRIMCQSLKTYDRQTFARRSLLSSIRIAGAEFQFDLHAGFVDDGSLYGWSYLERDWYSVPDLAWADLPKNTYTCPT